MSLLPGQSGNRRRKPGSDSLRLLRIVRGRAPHLRAKPKPAGQAMDREGHIYAFELDAILKFAPDGRFLNRVGSRGGGPGEWSAPQNIGVDGNGRLYVGEWRGIHVYDGNGRFLDAIPTNAYVMDLAISDNNDIWAIVGEQVVRSPFSVNKMFWYNKEVNIFHIAPF
jgi:hypothetical protein